MQKWIFALLIFLALLRYPSYALETDYEAILTDFQGTVEIQSAGKGTWQKAEININLDRHDRLRTFKESTAEITVNGEGMFSLEENSEYVAGEFKNEKTWFELISGTVLFKIDKLLTETHELRIQSKNAVVAIRGTEGAIETQNNEEILVGLYAGEVAVFSTDYPLEKPVILKKGFQTHIGKNKPPAKPYALKKHLLRHKKKMKKIKKRMLKVRKKWNSIKKNKKKKLRRQTGQKRFKKMFRKKYQQKHR